MNNLIQKYSKIYSAGKKYNKTKILSKSKIQNDFIISQIPPEGITINNPGNYQFSNNIDWTPISAISAITIQSSDVVLDLNNFTLECINKNNLETIGINVTKSLNILIKNGKIFKMGLKGIDVDSSKNITIQNITIDLITTDNIIEYIVPVGILFTKCDGVLIENCNVQKMLVKADSMAGIQITETMNSKIINCSLNDFVNLDGACTGFGHFGSNGSLIENCTVNNLQSFFNGNIKTQGHTCIGFVPFFSTNLSFINCKATNITGCCDDAHGLSVFLCINNIIIKGCIIDNIKDGVGTNTGAKATGIEVYATGVIVSDCIVSNISAINPQDKQCTGYSCAVADNVKFINCKAINVQVVDEYGKQNSCIGYGTGFGWAPDVRPEFIFPSVNILYEKCSAKNCQVGFDSWYHIDSTWKNICTCNCGISILNLNNSQRTLSCNPCSECNPPITRTIDNIAKNNKFINIKAKYC